MRDELKEILEDVRPDIDFETESMLIDNNVLESFDVLTIVAEIEDAFDIKIRPRDIVSENFNSLDAMEALIKTLAQR